MIFDRSEFEKRKRNKDAFITDVLDGKKLMLKGTFVKDKDPQQSH